MKRRAVAGIVVSVVAALAVGAGLTCAQEQEHQRQIREHDRAVHALYEERKAELDKTAASIDTDADKAALFVALDELEEFKETLEADEPSFLLHDGTLYKHDDLLDEVGELGEAAKARVVEGYEAQLAALTLDPNTEGVTKEALAENAAALQVLADGVEADAEERDVWGSEGERATFAAKVAKAVEADNAKIAEIGEEKRVEAERIVAEEQAAAIASTNQSYISDLGYYDGGYSGYYSRSSGEDFSGGSSSGNTLYWYQWGDEPIVTYESMDSDGTLHGGNADGMNIWGD
ncbi:hypothetical protein B5F40_10590 [Gordonibacter sp. An230]|uniref:hypothetical protein n=1 Tax=Gordonibacter sp. An230 TaxID=1965592 RepID=UPI000B36E6C0|nr:hypothetical protein [Gordonibacter sp. An230]OUO89545.1 hypothetical protein B5F40_10590 [Gordonibacter sp. An230]